MGRERQAPGLNGLKPRAVLSPCAEALFPDVPRSTTRYLLFTIRRRG